jgi:hypothetical protein
MLLAMPPVPELFQRVDVFDLRHTVVHVQFAQPDHSPVDASGEEARSYRLLNYSPEVGEPVHNLGFDIRQGATVDLGQERSNRLIGEFVDQPQFIVSIRIMPMGQRRAVLSAIASRS